LASWARAFIAAFSSAVNVAVPALVVPLAFLGLM
jgi:hypothetical protein